jgi:hypothetical protein
MRDVQRPAMSGSCGCPGVGGSLIVGLGSPGEGGAGGGSRRTGSCGSGSPAGPSLRAGSRTGGPGSGSCMGGVLGTAGPGGGGGMILPSRSICPGMTVFDVPTGDLVVANHSAGLLSAYALFHTSPLLLPPIAFGCCHRLQLAGSRRSHASHFFDRRRP